jgi:hypothetical protein
MILSFGAATASSFGWNISRRRPPVGGLFHFKSKRHCRPVLPRSVALIGTAARYREIFGRAFSIRCLCSKQRPKLKLRPEPDAALIFMKGIGIPPRDQKESDGKVGMADYRVYIIGDDGIFINSRAFSCDNDPDAIEGAK